MIKRGDLLVTRASIWCDAVSIPAATHAIALNDLGVGTLSRDSIRVVLATGHVGAWDHAVFKVIASA